MASRPDDKLAREAVPETSARYRGWRVVVVCFCMALFCWGFGFYGHSVFLAELQRLHGWPTALIAGATTASYLATALLVAFVADGIRLLGLRLFILSGVAALAVSGLLLPQVAAPWQLYAIYLLQALGWASLGVAAISNVVGMWFAQKRGLAISLALNGASSGGILIAPALVVLIQAFGFATAMALAVAVMLVVMLPLIVFWLGQPPPGAEAEAGVESPIAPVAPALRKRQILAMPRFWSVTAPFALAIGSQVGFVVHQVAFLSDPLGLRGAAWAVALMTTMAVIGRLTVGMVIDRLDQRIASALSFASQAAAIVVMTQSQNPAVLYVACAAYGLSVGNIITFPALIVQREFPPRDFGAVVALSLAVGQLTYGLGPPLVGYVRDASGSYPAALWVCVALNIIAAAMILRRPRAT